MAIAGAASRYTRSMLTNPSLKSAAEACRLTMASPAIKHLKEDFMFRPLSV
jgi:hypothetical protein